MKSGIYAYCSQCGATINKVFKHEGKLREYILNNPKCPGKCGARFKFLSDGRIWDLRYEILPSEEDLALDLLKEIAKIKDQKIFGYEDLGPNSKSYRYPEKRFNFGYHKPTERATDAYFLNVYTKEDNKLERSYCFAEPDTLLQIAQEALKGYYKLKYK